MAYVAIIATMMFGTAFIGFEGIMDSGVNYEDAVGDVIVDDGLESNSLDTDNDGLPDRMEKTQYGTDFQDPDTDKDGLSDGWEVENGLDPLDPGDADEGTATVPEDISSECSEISFVIEYGEIVTDDDGLTYPLRYFVYTLPDGTQREFQDPNSQSAETGVYSIPEGKVTQMTTAVGLYCTGEIDIDDSGSPENGPFGDPDRDGLINALEAELGTNPNLRDSDADGLNDKWEADNMMEVAIPPEGTMMLFDPLDGNWDCPLINLDDKQFFESQFEGEWADYKTPFGDNPSGQFSCDAVRDHDQDSVVNFLEERFDMNPHLSDSDNDLLLDIEEIGYGTIALTQQCGKPLPVGDTISRLAPFTHVSGDELSWFMEDMDGDGRLNGPSDWDTDGDGMPDGYEYCYSDAQDHPDDPNTLDLLNTANSSDAYHDWDNDGLNNFEEYQIALTWGSDNFTSPWSKDTDNDEMPDGWEADHNIHPSDGANRNDDPDHDGWDANGNGAVTYSDLVSTATLRNLIVEMDTPVVANDTVGWVDTLLAGGVPLTVPLLAPTDGYVYEILFEVNSNGVCVVDCEILTRNDVILVIVEEDERFTNIMEYQARDRDNDGEVDGRSTDPLNPDTDGDGLNDGIEVMGWDILVVNRGVNNVHVTSDPGLWDTDSDGLSDFREFSEVCELGSNASNPDTDGDGLGDRVEALDGFTWLDSVNQTLYNYSTSPCMFDTDNDGLWDGEEVIPGQDGYITNANDSDTDNDGLKDGNEVLFVPRPYQEAVNPLNNDTDGDGMLDGWEMQVYSDEEGTRSHSLWIAVDIWEDPTCEIDPFADPPQPPNYCDRAPGGYVWNSWLTGFTSEPKYQLHELNYSGFAFPADVEGRWALNPGIAALPDALFDIDNDTLMNSMEAPDRWNTNPVDKDTDTDGLPDGWEVHYSEMALLSGLYAPEEFEASGSRGPMDPSIADSDNDGINDGEEDPDSDGLNRTGLINKYCPNYYNSGNANCHIDPDTPDGKQFYDDLENYTNYEEYLNGTNPITNDTDGDDWDDGPEVYYQDHDDDNMATGWEYYFLLDPFDDADAIIDSDGDGYKNWCEYKWDSNPREINSYPGQNQLCDDWNS